jgi:rare lipoprotein A
MLQMRAKIVAMGVIGAALLLPEIAQAEQVGHASWYALYSRTASGEMMNPSAMTAAHRSLPFGTKVLVENLNNGKAVVVRINDRGPFIKGRIIDVSKAAASTLGMLGSGTARVRVSTSGGASPKVAAKAEGFVKVASASGKDSAKVASDSDGGSPKIASASGSPDAVEGTPVAKSAKMASASVNKPAKTASASRSKSTKTAKASSRSTKIAKASSKSSKTAKASRKPAKIVTASKSKGSVKSEKHNVAGLMKSTRDLKRVASRASSRKTYAAVSRTSARKSVAVASRELGKGRRGQGKSVVLASSANPYGAFVRSTSFIN